MVDVITVQLSDVLGELEVFPAHGTLQLLVCEEKEEQKGLL